MKKIEYFIILIFICTIVFGIVGYAGDFGKTITLRAPLDNQAAELDLLLEKISNVLKGYQRGGDLKMDSLNLKEQTAPPTPAVNTAVIYIEDFGGGQQVLRVKFDDGTVANLTNN